MDENLVGYLLNALDPDEHRAVEAYLSENAEARAKLERLERALVPLAADAEAPAPPPGLALAAIGRIAEHKCRPLPPAPPPPRNQIGPTGWRWSRRADVLAAAALLVFVGGLGLPFLMRAWHGRDRVACENNLRTFWGALQTYSTRTPGGAFPMVEEKGPSSVAGAFIPMLREAGALNGDAVTVACPGQGRRVVAPQYGLADLAAAYENGGDGFEQMARELAGDYAYSLGYRQGPTLVGLRDASGGELPILADRAAGSGNSLNHGGAGQNVLRIDGTVRWATKPTAGVANDNIYINQHNLLRAGDNRTDTVLGPGDARPGPAND